MLRDPLTKLLGRPATERVDLAMALWDGLTAAEQDAEFELTLDQRAEPDRRLAEHIADPTSAIPGTRYVGSSSGFIQRLANAFGTPNSKITLDGCGWGRGFATRYTYGVASVGLGGGGAMPDIERSGVLILWGYNPSFTRLSHATAVVAALKRGMRLIVVDPRRVGLAGKADRWLRVRPGTDGALALGLANLMIERGWYDRDATRSMSVRRARNEMRTRLSIIARLGLRRTSLR